ncbi:MAG: type VI secretion system baseplate subunit TssF [Planctomycetales bacterium]|nr:type VI secretion system baseplate subunit TssF [Planctomycetales bacterium]
MTASLYPYFEQELHFIRRDADEFARQFPAAAGQLLLERNRSRDPHVERLIEAFALLTARVQKRLDDDFPEITDGLLSTLHPHYLAPTPSLAVAQFVADAANPQPTGLRLPRGTGVRTAPVDGVACRYRTCYPVELWPIEVAGAQLETPPWKGDVRPPAGAGAVLRISLRTQGDLHFSQLPLERLRFHLHGDQALTALLYEALFTQAIDVELRGSDDPDAPQRRLGAAALSQVGFAQDESLLPAPPGAATPYRLLTELFAFPDKFFFFDVDGLGGDALDACEGQLDLLIYLRRCDERLASEVGQGTFRLGCSPVVNLFPKICEPVRVNHTRTEYLVKPDVAQPRGLEIYSVDQVVGVRPGKMVEYLPFYGLNHENSWEPDDENRIYWQTQRRPAAAHDDRGSDVYLRLVDIDFSPGEATEESVTVTATCTNRGLPALLPSDPMGLRLELESAAPVKEVRCLKQPTAPLQPPTGRRAQWRLASHLALNHLSLTEPEGGLESLREILRLYDFADAGSDSSRAIVNTQMIDGVRALRTRRTVARIGSASSGGPCRGVAIEIELDEENYRTVGPYLFGSVLERFFGLYCTVNSFTQLELTSRRGALHKKWPPRSGEAPLL